MLALITPFKREILRHLLKPITTFTIFPLQRPYGHVGGGDRGHFSSAAVVVDKKICIFNTEKKLKEKGEKKAN